MTGSDPSGANRKGQAQDTEQLLGELQRQRAELERRNQELQQAQEQRELALDQLAVLYSAARAVLEHRDFEVAAQAVFNSAKKAIGATAGYVALLSDDGSENEVLYLDAGGQPCTVDLDLPMPIRGLREVAYRTGEPAYDNDFAHSDWMKFMPEGHARLDSVMFVPLLKNGKGIGLLGLANKPGGFTDADARLGAALGDMAALALQNSRNLEALEKSRDELQVTLDSIGDAVVILDNDEQLVHLNPAAEALLGWTRSEAAGRPLGEVVVLPSVQHMSTATGLCIEDRRGAPHQVSVVVAPIGKAHQAHSGFVLVIRDETARKAAEEALAQERLYVRKMEAIGQLSAGIAHDFNNLLSPIVGFTEMTRDDLRENPVLTDRLDKVLASAERARRIVEQLLAYGRRQMFRLREIGAEELLRRAGDSLHRELPAGVELCMECVGSPGTLCCDPDVIRGALSHLCANALWAMPHGGVLTLRVDRVAVDQDEAAEISRNLLPGDYIVLMVGDTGVGMDPAMQERIFEPFFSTKPKWEAAGLGLSAVHGAIAQHQGAVRVTSEPGKGSTFELFLPVHQAARSTLQ
jgi:PAS domain S-box-containing protein